MTSTEPIEITPTATQPDQMIEDEIMETYKPKTSRLYGSVVDDEDNVSGVDIDFD